MIKRGLGFACFLLIPALAGGTPITADLMNHFLLGALAIILMLATISRLLAHKLGIPHIATELLLGALLGSLAWQNLPGGEFVHQIMHDKTLSFLAEFGLILLLFEIGLETSWIELKKTGAQSILIGMVGVAFPFFLGYFATMLLIPQQNIGTYLFVGASLAATSIAIVGRLFKDFNFLQRTEARIILGAAVIDDILCIMILSIVSELATTGNFTPNAIILLAFKSILFLLICMTIGRSLSNHFIPKLLARTTSGLHALIMMIIMACIGAVTAHMIGLETIIGAFAAGLMLEESLVLTQKQATQTYDKHTILHMIAPLNYTFVPIFFILTGAKINLGPIITNPYQIAITLAILSVAFIGKMVTGLFSPAHTNKLIVALGMTPRGEVGLIFTAIGYQLDLLSSTLFSVLVIVMLLTTIIPPIFLKQLIQKEK